MSVIYHPSENVLVDYYTNYDEITGELTYGENRIELVELDPTIELLEFYKGVDQYDDYDPIIAELIARCPELQKSVREEYETSLKSDGVGYIRFPGNSQHHFILIDGTIYDWNFEFSIAE